ncbi:MAG: zf-HC2 domain-containing protein [Clostridia bacterium]|nr:zf-HC2 domain-containing protein [Clostridia bacterium]
MNCEIVKDLLPLYIDKCCSAESSAEIEKHLKKCDDCKIILGTMKTDLVSEKDLATPVTPIKPINYLKASLLQTSLLFVSFALITLGVYLEAKTPSGWTNSNYAFSLVVPFAGFMLSLANWHFIRLYNSKKAFSKYSCLITLLIIVLLGLWTGFYYDFSIFDFVKMMFDAGLKDTAEAALFFSSSYIIGLIITPILCLASKLFSAKYADFLGKE